MMLSIIIVNWNTRDLLAACLNSIQKFMPASDCDIWVVDNASSDDSVAMVQQEFPRVNLIVNTDNTGFARANNQAARLCEGEYILFINSDAMLINNSLPSMLEFLREFPDVAICGPKICNPDLSFQASYAKFPTFWSEFLLLTGLSRWLIGPYAPSPPPLNDETSRQVDWVSGAAMLARASAIREAGFFDERYALYSEETHLCWKLHQKKWQIWYLPNASVAHVGGASSRQRSKESLSLLYESKARFFADAYGAEAGRTFERMLKTCLWLRIAARSPAQLMARLKKKSLPAQERDLFLFRSL